jgi:putative colanic acid biosynthesis acetyltransferase WcaF
MSDRLVQDLSRFRIPTGFRGRSGATVLIWQLVQATLSRMSPQPLYGWRRLLLRLFGARIGERVLIRATVRVTYPWNLAIGANSWVGDYAELYSLGQITIGSSSVVSQRCYLCTGSHHYDVVDFPIFQRPIEIGDQAWVATDTFIAPGVRVGEGAVVGARSTVLNDIPAFTVNAGSPARTLRPRGERHSGSPADALTRLRGDRGPAGAVVGVRFAPEEPGSDA